jgi:hypothetical protein
MHIKRLNTHVYYQLPPKSFGVFYTIFTESIAVLAQTLYAYCNVDTLVVHTLRHNIANKIQILSK